MEILWECHGVIIPIEMKSTCKENVSHHVWSLEERKQIEEEHPSPPQKKKQHTHIYIYIYKYKDKYTYIYIIYITNIFHRFLFYSGLSPKNPAASAKGQRFTWKPRPWAVWIKSRQKARLVNSLAKTLLDLLVDFVDWKVFTKTLNIFVRVVTINSGLICNCIYIIHIMRK